VVRGGTSCFPTSMTMAGIEPAIFGSTNAISLRLVQQGAGQSFGPTGQPDMSVLEPSVGGWRATEDWLRFAEGIRPRADLSCDR
jgi:hypothetical protein